jgi:acetolactate synthase I/II/III large subunit
VNPLEKTGAQIFIETLKRHGIDTIFGFPGGAVLPIYDALYHSDLRHILTRHEQGAAHMAEGYAVSTGKLGVVVATSGPGATNLVTGIADAKMDSVPVLFITGQVASFNLGTDAFQEADIFGITIPITNYNALVRNVDNLVEKMEEAIIMSTRHRPGPSLVDIPKDIQVATTSKSFVDRLTLPKHHIESVKIEGDLQRLAEAINKADRPLLYVGGGAINSGAFKLIQVIAEKANIPVVMTLKGLGAFPGTHKLALGMVGMHGTRYANEAMKACDLLIGLGVRFDDRVTGNPYKFSVNAKKAHVDIDITEINKVINVDYPIKGDLREVLDNLSGLIEIKGETSWTKQCLEWKQKYPLKFKKEGELIKPQMLIDQLSDITGGNAIITTDVGQNQMWAALFYKVNQPRSFISSGGLGTMGFGLPASLGAKIGRPDREVICFTGDGGIQMTIQELSTAVMYRIPVKIVIINNGYLGMVRQWQELFFDKRYSHTKIGDFNPDFAKIAQEGYGIPSMTISKSSELHQGIDFLLGENGPVMLNVIVPEEEKVFPMIPAGGTYDQIMEEPD